MYIISLNKTVFYLGGVKNQFIKIFLYSIIVFLSQTSFAQSDSSILNRPNTEKGATIVKVGIYIMDIESINNKEQSFTIDFIVRLRWKDERLKTLKGNIPLNSVWHPNVRIFNLRESDALFPEIITLRKDGIAQFNQRYHATLSSPLDFKEFPFDKQILPISLLSFGYTPDEVKFEFDFAGGSDSYSISDWSIEVLGEKITNVTANMFNDSSEDIVRPKLDYELKAKRHIQYFWWKILAPLTVILFLSWAVFWIDPTQIGTQIGVSGTSILSLVAFLYKLDLMLPSVSYLTNMDHFVFAVLAMVFFAYLEALVSTSLAVNGRKPLALKLDLSFRIIYPIIFGILVLIFWT